ncbi:MAG TPA: class I SAM-dependent methyltransferase [Verrucomicrobiales bacterium]|nr:class I SAM-dependent methyltransferase [Verrucomicrobiales bacterium]
MAGSLPSTERFSDRVADYVRWRPHYPAGVVPLLRSEGVLPDAGTVADIGSGTGISCRMFLDHGYRVMAVEPNTEMRAAAGQWLGEEPGFVSVDGTAEGTGLGDGSVEMVFAAQAFHWFDRPAAKREFARILKPGGATVLCWNNRDETDPFQQEYEQVLRRLLPDYTWVSHKHLTDDEIAAFFEPLPLRRADLAYHQTFDLAGLKGRLLSSSYCPKSGPAHDAVMQCMEELFARYAENGALRFSYITNVYWGEDQRRAS